MMFKYLLLHHMMSLEWDLSTDLPGVVTYLYRPVCDTVCACMRERVHVQTSGEKCLNIYSSILSYCTLVSISIIFNFFFFRFFF